MPSSDTSRHFDFHLALGIPLALMAALLLFDPSGLDFALARPFYEPGQGFAGRYSFWLEDILHDRAKQAVILLGMAAVAGFLLSLLTARLRPWRRQLGYLVLALGVSTAVVTPLKALTGIQCPWSLSEFGGTETFVPLLGARPPTDKPGRCWPGGHASAGFSLFAVFFALRDRRPRAARAALAVALALGGVFSLGRMMQGAHFFSHNLWTLLIDWTLCLLAYRWMLYRAPRAVPRQADTMCDPNEIAPRFP
jgi:membrane-associated PAP2 superfamily phosphatase